MPRTTRTSRHPGSEINGTRRLVAAIVQDLRRLYGTSGRLDEAGAERHLGFIAAQARKEAARLDASPRPDAAERSENLPGRGALTAGARSRRAARITPERALNPLLTVRVGLVARTRRQIAEGSYESEERLEAAICGLADEMGI